MLEPNQMDTKTMKPSQVKRQLKQALIGHNLHASVVKDVEKIALQVAGDLKSLSPATLSQLVDFAECEQRLLDAREMAEVLKAEPALWLRVNAKIQTDTSLKRSLFRDLFVSVEARQDKPDPKKPKTEEWSGTV